MTACEHCGRRIERGIVSYRRNRHCSHACKSATVRKIDPTSLREAATAGMTIVAMAKKFGAQRATVRKWLEQDGLWMTWWKQRYCA
jgi:hypothetical protein